jgi:hypothetical protein
MLHLMSVFDNFDVLMKFVPQVQDVKPLYKATDCKMVLSATIDYPWPLSDRELIMHVTGVPDYNNRGALTLSKYKEIGSTYFDYVTPEENS